MDVVNDGSVDAGVARFVAAITAADHGLRVVPYPVDTWRERVAYLPADSIIGAWLMKREGRNAWGALREALQLGRMPAKELADGALILIGGTLMLTPGFLSDVVALFLILPVTRPVARLMLTSVIARKLTIVYQATQTGTQADVTPTASHDVVQGEVVDD